jgi:predicted Zn-dependent protease
MVLSVTVGSSSKETARAFISKTGAIVIRSEAIQVNGLPSQHIISEIQTQKVIYRVISYFIEKGKNVFMFHGLTSIDYFQKHEPLFDYTMHQFKELTDPKRINVKPDRIRIRPTSTSDTLENTLRSFGIQNEKMIEIALLNGRYLNQMIPANTLIKVVVKGR